MALLCLLWLAKRSCCCWSACIAPGTVKTAFPASLSPQIKPGSHFSTAPAGSIGTVPGGVSYSPGNKRQVLEIGI